MTFQDIVRPKRKEKNKVCQCRQEMIGIQTTQVLKESPSVVIPLLHSKGELPST